MTKPLDGECVALDASLLRMPKPPPGFLPDNWRADWDLFRPSSIDEEDATRRGKPVRVSVWDDARTTVEQARAFRNGPSLAVTIDVQDVADVATAMNRALPVVFDPLESPDSDRPGADGHAGIEHLERAKGESKQIVRAVLQALADCAELWNGTG